MAVPPKGPMSRRQNYPTPKCCVFCMKVNGSTDEHIIPRGIGGNLVIKNGTCLDCLSKISPFESRIINSDFEAARVFLELQSNTGKYRSKLKNIVPVEGVCNSYNHKHASSENHTGIVIFRNYPQPGLELNRPKFEPFPNEVDTILKCFIPESRPGTLISGSPINSFDFPLLLAKIAHSYWVAENGLTSINFVLPGYILGEKSEGLGYYLGGYYNTSVPGGDLHFIHCGNKVIYGIRYAFVDIGLFSNYGPQTNYRGGLKFEVQRAGLIFRC